MTLLNAEALSAAQITFSTMFAKAFESAMYMDPAWEQLATIVDSKTKIVQHNWLGAAPAMSEWLDERAVDKVSANKYQITSKKWANGLEVDEDDLEDDNLGLYAPKIQELAFRAKIHKVHLLADFLVNGFATTKYGSGFDQVAFFSASHKYSNDDPSSGQSNTLTATLDDSGAFSSAFQKMISFTDQKGEPLGYYPTHLIYGPANRENANQLLKAERLANGASNTNYMAVTPVLSEKLVDMSGSGGIDASKYWFLADLSKPIKPLIWQTRRPVRFRTVGQETGESVDYQTFKTAKIWFGCDARYNAGYGMWATVVGSNGTT